jgi:hypothetical protein
MGHSAANCDAGGSVNIDARLRKLEVRYRAVLSATVAAKAKHLSLNGERSATAIQVERAKAQWRNLEARKAGIVAQMEALEDLEHQLVV